MIDEVCKIDKILPLIFRLDKDIIYDVKIRKHREKRSLDQNAYCWKLINEMGNILKKSKEEIYLQMLKDYGQSEIVSILSSINPKGYFKYFELIGSGVVNNKEFNHYKIFKGSSEFDSKEMSIFIEGVIQEAKQLGIQTLTPNQLLELRSMEASNEKK